MEPQSTPIVTLGVQGPEGKLGGFGDSGEAGAAGRKGGATVAEKGAGQLVRSQRFGDGKKRNWFSLRKDLIFGATNFFSF